MDVIPLILKEEVVLDLPLDLLEKLSDCSTEIVKQRVIKYVQHPDANPKVVSKIKKAYEKQLKKTEYLNSEDVAEYVSEIEGLDYSDIKPSITLQQLEYYKKAIDEILYDDSAVPYIAPIDSSIVKNLIRDLITFSNMYGNKDVKQFADRLKKHSSLFKDSRHAAYKGTVVKKVVKDKPKFEILARGIEFMIDNVRSKRSPESWRYL